MKELTTDQRQIDFSAMKMFAGTKETQEDVFKAFTDMLVTLRKQKLTQADNPPTYIPTQYLC